MIEDDFKRYMEEFKKFPLKIKEDISLEQLKLIVTLAEELCKSENINSHNLLDSKSLNILKDDYTHEDYVEAIIVYINAIQNLLCDYSLNIR